MPERVAGIRAPGSRGGNQPGSWDGPSRKRIRLLLVLFVFSLYMVTTRGTFLGNADYVFMFGVTESLFQSGSWAVSPAIEQLQPPVGGYQQLAGADGRLYFPKGMSYSLLLVPFYAIGHAATLLLPGAGPAWHTPVTMLAASAAGPLLGALECLLIFEIAAAAGFALRAAALAATTSAMATILWPSSRENSVEVLHGLLVTATFLFLIRMAREQHLRWAALTGCSLGALLLSQPAMLAFVLVPATIYLLVAGGPRLRADRAEAVPVLAAYAVPLVAALALLAWVNHVRYGSALLTGYEWAVGAAWVPLYVGVYGLLFSAGKSLFLYSPPLLLSAIGVRTFLRHAGPVGTFPICLLALFVAGYGVLAHWSGDGAWGPRYLIPLTGSLAALTAGWFEDVSAGRTGRWMQRFGLAVVVAGVLIQCVGVATSTAAYFGLLIRTGVIAPPPGGPLWTPVVFNPELSPVAGRARLLLSRAHHIVLGTSLSWRIPDATGTLRDVPLGEYDAVDLWLTYVPMPGALWVGLSLAGCAAVVASGTGLARVVARRRRPEDDIAEGPSTRAESVLAPGDGQLRE